jgi:UDP-N-acetylmuramate dehydrogenase
MAQNSSAPVMERMQPGLGDQIGLAETAATVRQVRAEKGMIHSRDSRTAGSVFMSPTVTPSTARQLRAQGASVHHFSDGTNRVSASWMIQRAGFRLGQSVATGIRICGKHYTLKADEAGTAKSFAAAATRIAERVKHETGLTLTAEPDLLGNIPAYSQLKNPYPPHS